MFKNNGGGFRIAYYEASGGNVGDDLNLIVWGYFFNGYIRGDSETALIGIGSVLDNRFDAIRSKIVFGAGARSSDTVPDMSDGSWDIRFVRGPNTVKALGIPEIKYISDPAILTPLVYSTLKKSRRKSGRVGLVPYLHTNFEYARLLGGVAELDVISVKQPPEIFIQKLLGCDYVYAEAMHGAILADAFRIPWKPIRISNKEHEKDTHDFKWNDWLGSLDMHSDFITLPNFYDDTSWRGSLKKRLESIIGGVKLKTNREEWCLSNEELLSKRVDQILESIEILKKEMS
ncbi:polysaccharide pyruvyl transferase family protein [Marinobacterium aestuariivivens]|uniref:Polysaccharide pyruvyl transferase family protein n=1 Tax=Marinobacterium aestuariivivens TaxID=1698799 RepID=A0ABW1ZTE6_9GAMM